MRRLWSIFKFNTLALLALGCALSAVPAKPLAGTAP